MKQENKDNATGIQNQVYGGKAYIAKKININHYLTEKPITPITPIKRIPHQGTSHFVGRSEELAKIHSKLYSQQNASVFYAVGGMGGVGKTELAVKYARQHENDYPGGVCWFSARFSNIATEILAFAKNYLKLEIPQDFQEDKQQIDWCWQNWQPPEGLVLVIFDDVTDLKNFADYLPANERFRVLITTRLRNIDTNIEEISLDVLSSDEALELFKSLIGKNGDKKANKELEIAQELCKLLGYLPLGIELVGRYIAKQPPDRPLAEMLEQLKQQQLQQEAINTENRTLSTAQFGVKAAFELSWLELNEQTQKVAALLSLFAPDIFAREWVKFTTSSLHWADDDVNAALEQLYQCHLVDCLESEDIFYYRTNILIRAFLKEKLEDLEEVDELKLAFAGTFIEIARSIPHSPTLEIINSVKNAIPHLAIVAENLTDIISNEDFDWVFIGLYRFYSEQGLYTLAEHWCEQCVLLVKSRLGENHPQFIPSLNNLASVYESQGRYAEAESLYIKVLELTKRILGKNHSFVATSLGKLANFYYSQGRYDEAESLYIKALELRKRILEKNHTDENYTDYATSLGNLANLYNSQARYDKAKSLYIQELELTKRILGENHPDYATSLSNLAWLYKNQGRYNEAEPLFFQALQLRKRILGENHSDYATSLVNLALLYNSQERYDEAEPLLIQALDLRKLIFGENHSNVAKILNNLAGLYNNQGRFDEAEPLYIQASELIKRTLGENHPNYATCLNNLALLYNSQERYDEAEPLLIQALDLRKRIFGENHPDFAEILNNLANFYDSQGNYDKAKQLYIRAFKIFERQLGMNHPYTNVCRENLETLCSNMVSKDSMPKSPTQRVLKFISNKIRPFLL